jgi:hypothetical protein
MKKILISFLGLLLFITACKEAPIQSVTAEDPNEYPSKIGSIFYYDIDSTDQNGVKYNIGYRKSDYGNLIQLNGVEYLMQIDSTTINNTLTTAISYFRKTSAGVYFYVDTSAFTSLIPAEIPDSLRSLIKIDSEITVFSFPLQVGKYWTAFSLSFFNIPLIELKISVYTKDNFEMYLNKEIKNITAQRMIFELIIVNNPLDLEDKTKYSATGWYVNGIGFVKIEGSNLILSMLAGGTINLQTESDKLIQTMTGYRF